jgi:chromate transporter
LFFGYHVWWPHGFGAAIDPVSVLLTVAAAVALLIFKQSVLRVIAAAAVIGLVVRLLL